MARLRGDGMSVIDRLRRLWRGQPETVPQEPVEFIKLRHAFTIYHKRGQASGEITVHGPRYPLPTQSWEIPHPAAADQMRKKLWGFKDEVMREGYYNGPEWIAPASIQAIVFAEEHESEGV